MRRIQRIALFALLVCTLTLHSVRVNAQPQEVIFYFSAGDAVTRLDKVSPLSDGLRAILAMYALQRGTGCTRSETYQCVLTAALEIGGQCSDEHLQLVKTWFKSGMPKMDGYAETHYRHLDSLDDLRNICYQRPDGASIQSMWDLIRVSISGTRVRVYAHGNWMVRDKGGEFRFDTEYEVGPSFIKVISHNDISKKEKR